MTAPEPPTLDRAAEPWTGTFPGLGTVRIAADGAVDVIVDETDDEDPTLKERALRWGWGEALSFVRRGFQTAIGAAACPPGDGIDCLLLPGDPHDVAIVMASLVQRGWSVLGDRFTPVTWEGASLIAQPRQAPLIVSKRRLAKLGLDGATVRADSDSRIVDWTRATTPRTVAGIAQVSMRRPHEDALVELTGQKRFEAAAQLILGGALLPLADDDAEQASDGEGTHTQPSPEVIGTRAAELVAEHLRLAALPTCRLRLAHDTLDQDVEALLSWWGAVSSDRGAA